MFFADFESKQPLAMLILLIYCRASIIHSLKKNRGNTYSTRLMTTDTDSSPKKRSTSKKRASKYIPHLGEFYFRPEYDWTVKEAEKLYRTKKPPEGLTLDHIYFKDCMQGMKTLPENCIDLVIADPPFGIEFDGKSGVYNRDSTLVIEGYEEAQGSYNQFTKQWIAEIPRILKPHGSIYIFSGWTNLEAVLKAAREVGLVTINHMIWQYPFGVFTKKRFVTSHYHILLLVKDSKDYFFNKIEHYPEDVWRINREYRTGQTKNGTKLPTEVISRCIDFSSKPGDIVLDPFMGNGTTAVAAKSNWRHFVGFEVNKQLKPVIKHEIQSVKVGKTYIYYRNRLPTIEDLSKLYPRAYKEYLKRESIILLSESNNIE